MTDTVRCPACRGAKKVPKLGGMIGECNTCAGKGTILASDKPKPVEIMPLESNVDIINAVSNALPVMTHELKDSINESSIALPEEPAIKVDPKKALYKRKSSN